MPARAACLRTLYTLCKLMMHHTRTKLLELDRAPSPSNVQVHSVYTMKLITMLLFSATFLATGVEARPGQGPWKTCKRLEKKLKKLEDTC